MSNEAPTQPILVPALVAHQRFRAAHVEALRLEKAALERLLATIDEHGFASVTEFPFIIDLSPQTKIKEVFKALDSLVNRVESAWKQRSPYELLAPPDAETEMRRKITDRIRQCEAELPIAQELAQKALLFLYAATRHPLMRLPLIESAENLVQRLQALLGKAKVVTESQKNRLRDLNTLTEAIKKKGLSSEAPDELQEAPLDIMLDLLVEAELQTAFAAANEERFERRLREVQADLDALRGAPPKTED